MFSLPPEDILAIFLLIHGHTKIQTERANITETPIEISAIAHIGRTNPKTEKARDQSHFRTQCFAPAYY